MNLPRSSKRTSGNNRTGEELMNWNEFMGRDQFRLLHRRKRRAWAFLIRNTWPSSRRKRENSVENKTKQNKTKQRNTREFVLVERDAFISKTSESEFAFFFALETCGEKLGNEFVVRDPVEKGSETR